MQSMLRGVELITGVVSDPLFGPVVMFGSGGTAVELFGDRVLRILPLTDQDAHEMVRSIRGAPLFSSGIAARRCATSVLWKTCSCASPNSLTRCPNWRRWISTR